MSLREAAVCLQDKAAHVSILIAQHHRSGFLGVFISHEILIWKLKYNIIML